MTAEKPSRLQRIIRLLGLLQGGHSHNVQSLADACGVTRRTIFRDLEDLRGAEVPLAYDFERQLYSIPSKYFLAPTQFTVEEAMAVTLLCHELGDEERLPFLQDARMAAVKIENTFPERLKERLRKYANAVRIRLGAMTSLAGQTDNYRTLLDSIAERKAVRMEYESFTEPSRVNTKLYPYRLVFNLHSWYVVGRSSVHRETRTFNLRRIARLEKLDDEFELPRNFSLQRYFANAWRMIPEAGPDQEVCVKFAPLVARNVAEVKWHPTQTCEFLADGSLLYRATISGIREISWWVMGYGDQAEVLAPQALRELIVKQVRNLARTYAND